MAAINPVGSNIPFNQLINNASDKYQVPATLIAAVIKQESGYNPKAISGPGAGGLMQLMPGTAAGLGVTNVYDPAQNINGGVKYLAQQLKTFNGNTSLALAAYNAGPGAVKNAGNNVPQIPETQGYVKSIMANYAGGNIDPNSLTNVGGSSSNPLNIGETIVNGIQKIFQTLASDSIKFIIYIILFGVFVFFGYKALSGSPAAREGIRTTKSAGKAAATTVKKIVEVMPK